MRLRSCSSALRFGLLLSPAHPRSVPALTIASADTSLPSAPRGSLFLLAPPIKPLPYSACKQAGAGRAVSAGYRQPMSFYTPAHPRSETSHSSLCSWWLGWSLGDCSQDSQTPRLRPCYATLRTTATSPPLLALLLVPGSSLPSAPRGSLLLALLANFCEHLFFFLNFSLRSKFTLCKQNDNFTYQNVILSQFAPCPLLHYFCTAFILRSCRAP